MKRRDFIRSSALMSTSIILPFSSLKQTEKIKIAILGTGWWAQEYLLPSLLVTGHFEVTGLCDVDSAALQTTAELLKNAGAGEAKLFSDYKELFKLPGLQAVVIATPTHWHALQFIAACEAGLHVFQEKPISYDIREGQAMLEAQRKANNVVQVDFPRVMTDINGQIKDFIQSGEFGNVQQVLANINNNERELEAKPVPETIEFETFIGPAPKVKFMTSRNGAKSAWRGQYAFSKGVMMDWGIHYIHNVRQILDLDIPNAVGAIGGNTRYNNENPDHLDVRYEFNGLPVNWSHKSWGYTAPNPLHNIGVFYYGEKGTIFAADRGWEFYPAGSEEKIVHGDMRLKDENGNNLQPDKTLFVDLFYEFAEGINNKSNIGITNTIQDAFKTTSTVLFGDLAYQSKCEIMIDKPTMNIKNNEEAQKLLKREYRAPYKHPYTS